MSIVIKPEQRDFIRRELESGHFVSEQELIAAAIELLRARQEMLGKLQPDGTSSEQRSESNGDKVASLKELILSGPSLEGIDLERDQSTSRELEL